MNAGDFVLSYHQIYVQNALDIYHIVTCKMSWELKLFSGMFQNRSNIVQNSKNSEERDYVNLELRVCIHYNHTVFLYQMYSLQTVFGRPPVCLCDVFETCIYYLTLKKEQYKKLPLNFNNFVARPVHLFTNYKSII